MKITFAGHELWLDPSGVLYWPDHALLVVADLHLEKSSHFAGRGYFLPPYDSHDTLERLHAAIAALSAKQIMILGDCFHDAKGFFRLPKAARALFEELRAYDPLWIIGNHDGDFVPDGMTGHQSHDRGGIVFRHEAGTPGLYEISGHYHPKAEINHKGAMVTRPCFVEDGRRLILPSFGSFTGGLSVTHPSIAGLMAENKRVYLKGRNKIYLFESQKTGSNL